MSDFSFDDLRCNYQTGRSYVVSGEGRHRLFGYRNGVQCALGDLERSQWCQMVKELIQRQGEQELHQNLLDHLKEHNHQKASARDLAFEALILHASRIFDNALWVDFLEFNQKYRPEKLASTRLILIFPECCKIPGYITQARFDKNINYNYCPHCKRWTRISLGVE